MKRLLLIIPLLAILVACAGSTYTINVRIPAGTLVNPMLSYVQYSFASEEICPNDDKIKITLTSPAPDMTVALIPVDPKDRLKSHKAQYLTPGFPTEFEVIKGAWYKVGLMISNNTNADVVYPLEVTNISEIRIEETVN